jgi:hypothetical protein
MQKQGTTWHCLAALGMLASCSLSIFAGGGADKKDAPEPLQPETVKVWRDAGAQSGWLKMHILGYLEFEARESLDLSENLGKQAGEKKTGITDAGLKELAGLKNLRSLNLFLTPVTNAGLPVPCATPASALPA